VTTPGQTVGPFFHGALPYAGGPDLVPPGSAGAIRLHGHVFDATGHYSFSTLTPGGSDPFFAITVFARGLTDRLFTRAYLGGGGPFLAGVDPDRRQTLIARPEERGFVFDIRLQGPGETVFLSFPRHRSAD